MKSGLFARTSRTFSVSPHEVDLELKSEALCSDHERSTCIVRGQPLNPNVDLGNMPVALIFLTALHHVHAEESVQLVKVPELLHCTDQELIE